MFTVNRIIGLVLFVLLIYGILKFSGVLPDWMPALPTGRSHGA